MQEQKGALSWTGFLGKLVAILGVIFLILVVLSWLRCSSRSSGSAQSVPEKDGLARVTGLLHTR